jgi:hypothetical protein
VAVLRLRGRRSFGSWRCFLPLRGVPHAVGEKTNVRAEARVLRPGLQALDLTFTAQIPPAMRTTFAALDHAIDLHIAEAQRAA